MFINILKFILPLFFISSGFVSGFFFKQYLFREECLNLSFSGNEEVLNQGEIDEISQLLNEKDENDNLALNANANNSSDNKEPSKNEKQTTGAFVGSAKSNKFYPVACHFAKRIKEENKVWFDSIEAGEKEGREYVECRN